METKDLWSQKVKRLRWREAFTGKDFNFWSSTIWSDESKFCQFSNSGNIYVWRKPGEAWKADPLQATIKHGAIGVVIGAAVRYQIDLSWYILTNGSMVKNLIGFMRKGLPQIFMKNTEV